MTRGDLLKSLRHCEGRGVLGPDEFIFRWSSGATGGGSLKGLAGSSQGNTIGTTQGPAQHASLRASSFAEGSLHAASSRSLVHPYSWSEDFEPAAPMVFGPAAQALFI